MSEPRLPGNLSHIERHRQREQPRTWTSGACRSFCSEPLGRLRVRRVAFDDFLMDSVSTRPRITSGKVGSRGAPVPVHARTSWRRSETKPRRRRSPTSRLACLPLVGGHRPCDSDARRRRRMAKTGTLLVHDASRSYFSVYRVRTFRMLVVARDSASECWYRDQYMAPDSLSPSMGDAAGVRLFRGPDSRRSTMNEAEQDRFRASVSEDRFATFLAHAHGDVSLAVALHEWNTEVSAALMVPVANLVIGIRNRLNDAAAARYGQNWLTTSTLLRPPQRHTVSDTRSFLRKRGAPESPGAIVAELPLQFWVALFNNSYDQTIWRTAYAGLFPRATPRPAVQDRLDRFRTLRNRIAHHEHLLNRDLGADTARIDAMLSILAPTLADRSRTMSTAAEVIARKPGRL